LSIGDRVTVSIDFLAELGSEVLGFYRSSYFDPEKNATEYLATSQCEATGARRALPCFDEPDFKAVFQVGTFTPYQDSILRSRVTTPAL
jgi:aminopeptidase N